MVYPTPSKPSLAAKSPYQDYPQFSEDGRRKLVGTLGRIIHVNAKNSPNNQTTINLILKTHFHQQHQTCQPPKQQGSSSHLHLQVMPNCCSACTKTLHRSETNTSSKSLFVQPQSLSYTSGISICAPLAVNGEYDPNYTLT